MEKEGTTKTFVVSTKIFVDAQNRRIRARGDALFLDSRGLHSPRKDVPLFAGRDG